MARRRPKNNAQSLTSGPARLCEAFGIDRQFDDWHLTRGEELWIAADSGGGRSAERRIEVTPRIGVTRAVALPLRYYMADSPHVSR